MLKPAPTAAPTAPGPPTGVSATAGNGAATVSWTAPPNGGSPITQLHDHSLHRHAAQPPTTITGSPPSTSTTVIGLTNGTSYTFTVTASEHDRHGPGLRRLERSYAVRADRPGCADQRDARPPATRSATVSWTAPSNGGSPITSYTVTPYIGTTAQTPATTVTGSPPSTSTTVTGLTNGTSYTFTVSAEQRRRPRPRVKRLQLGDPDGTDSTRQPPPA